MIPFILLTKVVGENKIEFLVDANKITAVQQLTDFESENGYARTKVYIGNDGWTKVTEDVSCIHERMRERMQEVQRNSLGVLGQLIDKLGGVK